MPDSGTPPSAGRGRHAAAMVELDYVPGLGARGTRRATPVHRAALRAQGRVSTTVTAHFAVVTNRTERRQGDRVAPREGGHDRAHPRQIKNGLLTRAFPAKSSVPTPPGSPSTVAYNDGRHASGRRRSEPGDADQEPALRSADGQRAPHTLQPQDHPALRRYPRMVGRDPPAEAFPCRVQPTGYGVHECRALTPSARRATARGGVPSCSFRRVPHHNPSR